MKKTFLLFAGLLTAATLFAQNRQPQVQMEDEAKEAARQRGHILDSAFAANEAALRQNPNDYSLLKNKAYLYYLKRDFQNALSLGQTLVQKPEADDQAYQVLGMVYKELAEYKEGEKLYKTALEKFPSSGSLYADYGDMLKLDNNAKDAISTWEKGIQQDVNNNSNYYYAAKYYAANNNLVWALLYGEIFVNIESYTPRTAEIKQLLYNGYKQLFTGGTLVKINADSKGFAKAYTDVLVKNAASFSGDTIVDIAGVRMHAVADWVNSGNSKKYPFRLFDLHRQLVDAKAFVAYNEWLFGDAADAGKYNRWRTANAAEMQQWEQLLHNVVFKIPAGQYYSE